MADGAAASRWVIERIVSGGQTGVDRAALDVALELGLAHGGWCPAGRRAEDGPIDPRYRLVETATPEYPERTERNVLDSDGTLILYEEPLEGGSELTFRLARKHQRPLLCLPLKQAGLADSIRGWLEREAIKILNVAGPRESSRPGITVRARQCLREVFQARV